MIADGKRLLPRESHVARDNINALLAVSVGELIVKLEGIDSLPRASFILHVTKALLVNVDLAQIVKKRYDSNRLLGILKTESLGTRRGKIIHKTVVYVKRMVEKSSLISRVEA